MSAIRRNVRTLPVTIVLLAAGITASAQITCNANAGAPLLARGEGDTEMLSDIVLTCSGGTPTPANDVVPQINLVVTLNTNVTSRITASYNGAEFSEALLLIDEPNAPEPPAAVVLGHRLLNCGNVGAPDNGPSGPAVCTIISTGNPAQTYDGTPGVQGTAGTAPCVVVAIAVVPDPYGCGRPNAYQGRLGAGGDNVVEFLGVPFDPPGPNAVRILRITNVRANAALLGPGGPHPINVDLAEFGSTAFSITPTTLTPGFALPGLTASIPAKGIVRVEEGFGSSWKNRNVAVTLANATFGGGVYNYSFPNALYPVEAAQNVPGTIYSEYGEAAFQWQNNSPNGPPSPNPPPGFGFFDTTSNLNYPLFSAGAGGVNTGIANDGIADSGTRIALTFVALGETVTVPSVIYLHPVASPGVTSGVMVLTSTDAAGAGPFTPGAGTSIHNEGTFVYEVLFAAPFLVEYADIPCAISGPLHAALVYPTFAPFYVGPNAGFPTPTPAHPLPTSIPRFNASGSLLVVTGAPPSTVGGE